MSLTVRRLPWFILALTGLLCIADIFLYMIAAHPGGQVIEGLYGSIPLALHPSSSEGGQRGG